MKRYVTTVLCLVFLLLLAIFTSLSLGSTHIPLRSLLRAIFGDPAYATECTILVHIRLSRTLAALVAGAGLSLSGVILQSVMANPLAGPSTIGVNAGAGFFVILSLSLFPTLTFLLPLFATLGALLVTLLVLIAARGVGGGRATIILAGIACTALFQAGISFFSVLDTDILAEYTAFSVGGLSGVRLATLPVPATLILVALLGALLLSRPLSALTLGDAQASALGIRVRPLRTLALLLASLSAAAAISFAGLLGFVGLVVPHIARRLVGPRLTRLFIVSPLVGALLLLVSDLGARTLFAPSDIPVGIVTALIGAPCFFVLLLRGRYHHA